MCPTCAVCSAIQSRNFKIALAEFYNLVLTDCRIAFRIDREVRRGTHLESCDSRYFVTRLDPETTTPSELQTLTRGHWEVGGVSRVGKPDHRLDCLHHIKDRVLNEDRHAIRRDGLGPRILKIRDLGVSILHLLRKPGDSVRNLAETIRFRPKDVLQTLGFSQCEQ